MGDWTGLVAAGALTLGFLAGPAVRAATYPVDDMATLPGRSTVTMKWRTAGPTPGDGNMLDGATAVTMILNTAPWIGRTGRVYMKLDETPAGPVQVEWTTQGRLLAGFLTPGVRALVYAGPIRARQLTDTLFVHVHADGRRLSAEQQLHFKFEIDVD